MRDNLTALAFAVSLALILSIAFIAVMANIGGNNPIAQWEKRHNYPYGYMCNSIFTLYEDTCDLKKRR